MQNIIIPTFVKETARYHMIHITPEAPYCIDPYHRKRFPTVSVSVGSLEMGGSNPVRLQSMTTVDTMDTEGSVAQAVRMIDAGCELVRLTTPSIKEAENLQLVKKELLKRGYTTPLVADIHFTPNAAEVAAKIVEKVRVNPGNYADKKKFEEIAYTDETYQAEIQRIEEKFTPLVLLCKQHGTAMRIGTNHGSLSDRILSRYGDTPEGMVESAMEFIRICEKHSFFNLVISMKASNALVMVQAYRLLAATMLKTGRCYPLHLGVTEAGDGEDGRIKSAVGIGSLLEDGLGDTVRVSLTEEPEKEIPVASKLVAKFKDDLNLAQIPVNVKGLPYNPYRYERRSSHQLANIGGKSVPVVVADLSDVTTIKVSHFFAFGYSYSVPLDKWQIQEQAADYVYIGEHVLDFEKPGAIGVITSLENWKKNYFKKPGYHPLLHSSEMKDISWDSLTFVVFDDRSSLHEIREIKRNAVLVFRTKFSNRVALFRSYFKILLDNALSCPVILSASSENKDSEAFQLEVSSEVGALMIDGLADGIWLSGNAPRSLLNSTAFGVLQATRSRISKTEYISCPSCGRTLFDLQETTAKIRKQTDHLKGLKIGIMGCIVNGPGEMADADYGYVGTGPGKITLYKEKTVVKKNVPEEEAVSELIELIKSHGDWVDPN
jgi:(E)-4-hydroxy-3-methylbut-2-enyl-diphosphate synthase